MISVQCFIMILGHKYCMKSNILQGRSDWIRSCNLSDSLETPGCESKQNSLFSTSPTFSNPSRKFDHFRQQVFPKIKNGLLNLRKYMEQRVIYQSCHKTACFKQSFDNSGLRVFFQGKFNLFFWCCIWQNRLNSLIRVITVQSNSLEACPRTQRQRAPQSYIGRQPVDRYSS